MKIREAKRGDIKAISRLATKTYVDTFGFKFSPSELKKNIEETRSVKFYNSVFGKDTILIAEEDNQMVGYAQFGDTDFTLEGVLTDDQELIRLYVLSDYQGRGIGKMLLETALSHPKLKNAKNIYLDVWEENLVAQKLYQSYGFEEVDKIGEDIIMRKRNA